MKHTAFIFLLLSFQLSFTQKKASFVKVISATTQDWISGAPRGRGGTTYTIKVGILSAKAITFKNIWIGKQHVPFDVQTFFTDPNKKPGIGDSVLLVYVKINQIKTAEADNKPLPTQYKGEALVEYMVAGKPKYFTIKKFLKLQMSKGI